MNFKSPECWTVMGMRRQHIPESGSWHQEAVVCTSQTSVKYSQVHSGTGRAQCHAALDLAIHVHAGVHDNAQVAEGGQRMHADVTNAHSCMAAALSRWSGSVELWWLWTPSITVYLELVGEQADPDILHTHLQPLQHMPVAVQAL